MKKSFFICSNCGYKSSKWLGKCPECSSWNSFVEEETNLTSSVTSRGRSFSYTNEVAKPVGINTVTYETKDRLYTALPEFDRVLGGIVKGQTILISGEPGIGKSTLLLSLAQSLAKHGKVIYINGEESNSQVKIRADRIGVSSENIFLFSANNLDYIMEHLVKEKASFIFLDSIQTVFITSYSSLPGNIVQVRESAYQLIQFCKQNNVVLIIVGHVTKSGSIAGPKVIEHMVDTVLYLEMDLRGYYRVLRSLKNRFYSNDETGFFIMDEKGLLNIEDTSTAFISVHTGEVCGVSFFPSAEGSRIIPVEIQALCSPTQFNYPKRAVDGFDFNRLYMLIAIMEKILRINLSAHDVYVNVTSGLRISDPALDLAVVTAIYSSFKEANSPLDVGICGEVGLTGEVRPILKVEKRIHELSRLGFKKIIIPYKEKRTELKEDINILPVKNIIEAVKVLY